MRLCAFQHVQKAVQVVFIVFQRLFDRLAHRLERSEMNDGIDRIIREQFAHRGRITKIHLYQREIVPAGNFPHPLETGQIAIGKIIGHHHIVPCGKKFHGNVAANIPGTAGNQYCFFHHSINLDAKIVISGGFEKAGEH